MPRKRGFGSPAILLFMIHVRMSNWHENDDPREEVNAVHTVEARTPPNGKHDNVVKSKRLELRRRWD